MKRVKDMLLGILLVSIGMPMIVGNIIPIVGVLLALVGLCVTVVAYVLDEND